MGFRETIDIEALLVMAYRQHQVDRVTPERVLGLVRPGFGYVSNAAIIARHLAYGDFIDCSPRAADILGSAKAAAAVPDDMLSVHDAVLALDDFHIERAGADCMVWDRETAEKAGVEIYRHEGDWFARAKRWGNGEPEPAVRRLTQVNTSIVVILNARNATRPGVEDLEVVDRRPIYRDNRKKPVGHEPVYLIPPETIAVQRAEYQAWHCALGVLAAALANFSCFVVTGPAAPLAPWEEKTFPAITDCNSKVFRLRRKCGHVGVVDNGAFA